MIHQMAAFDDRKIKQKESTVFIQVAADTLDQTRRHTLKEGKYHYHLTLHKK